MTRVYQYNSHGCQSNVRLYYQDGLLLKVEIETPKEPMPDKKSAPFKLKEEDFIAACIQYKIPYTEVDRAVTFEIFWDKYSKGFPGSSKKKSQERWNKLSVVDQVSAYDFIDQYNAWVKLNGIGRKLCETYLHQEPWRK